jgi:Tol biopolymer transport system component
MGQKEAIQQSDLENLRATSSSSTCNRKAYVIATVISVLLIISGVIYFLKFQVGTGLAKTETVFTKTNAGSSSSHVPNVDRIFFIKSNYNKLQDRQYHGLSQIKTEVYSVLSNGTDLKHYDKAETDMILIDALADLKSKTMMVYSFLNGKQTIFIQSWDESELPSPNSAIAFGSYASFFPDGSKIIYIESSQNNSGRIFNICTSDLKGSDKQILKTFDSAAPQRPQVSPDGKFAFYGLCANNNLGANLFKIDLKDSSKPEELLHEIRIELYPTFLLSPKGDQIAEIHRDAFLNVLKIYNIEKKEHKKIYESKVDFYIASWSTDGKFVYVIEELNQDLFDTNLLIKKIDVGKDDHSVTILKNSKGESIGTY